MPWEDDIKIDFQVNGEIKNINIAPILLIPFIENAFKHSFDIKNPVIIEIKLTIINGKLIFSVKNSKSQHLADKNFNPSGIGLSNVKRRLDLLYPGIYSLNIHDEEKFFEILLEIEIK